MAEEMFSDVFTRNIRGFGSKLWYMKNEGKFCDAVIIVGGQRIEVHSVVLAASSEYFENAFENSNSGAIKEVTINDMDSEILLNLIEFCYTGSLTLTESNLHQVLKTANLLSMNSIINYGGKLLKKIITVENSLSMFKIVRSINNDILMIHVSFFIRKNFVKVSQLQEFLNLDYSEMKELLSSNMDVNVTTVYEALKKWAAHDASRTNYFINLLDLIKLEHLPRDVLLFEFQSMCTLSNDCFVKFMNALTTENLQSVNSSSSSQCSFNNNTLIAVGDYYNKVSKMIEILDLDKNEWINIPYEESKKESFSAIAIQDKLMMIGGHARTKALDTIEYYNLKTGQEEYMPPMKYARYFSSAVKYGEHVYVIGGSDGSVLPYVERWDQHSKTWTTVASLANARCKFGAAILGNEIFAVGGKSDSDILIDVEAYEPITDKWRRIAPMNERREDHGVAAVNGFLYAVGGYSRRPLKTVERYDPKINKWTIIQSLAVPKYGLVATNFNGQLLITGGISLGLGDHKVEKYDESNEEWNLMPPLKNSRSHHSLVQIPWDLAKDVLLSRSSK